MHQIANTDTVPEARVSQYEGLDFVSIPIALNRLT